MLERRLAFLNPWVAAAALSVPVALMAWRYRGPQAPGVGLSAEGNLPAFYSALAMVAAAVATWLYQRRAVLGRRERLALRTFALLCFFFAFDEMLQIHERPERWTGVDWQVLYAPIIVAGGVAGLSVWWHFRWRVPAAVLLLAGAGCWFVSQLLEALQWDGDVLVHPAMQYYEELLEVSGSSLFILAMLVGLRGLSWTKNSAA